MTSTLRVAFAGTPEFAQIALAAIHQAGFPILFEVTPGWYMKKHFGWERHLPYTESRTYFRAEDEFPRSRTGPPGKSSDLSRPARVASSMSWLT